MKSAEKIDILSGVHGYHDGKIVSEIEFYNSDITKFSKFTEITVHNFDELTETAIKEILNSKGVVIGGFCHSGVCLRKYF